jgi:hypothetical protein
LAKDFFAMHSDRTRRIDTQSNLVASNIDDGYPDI